MVLAALVSVAVVVTVVGGLVLLRTHDRAGEMVRATRQARLSQLAMLDQETGLRGFLLSGEVAYLAPYDDGRAAAARSNATLRELVGADPLLDATLAAAAAWTEHSEVVGVDHEALTGASRSLFLDRSSQLFSDYRAQIEGLTDALSARREAVIDQQTLFLRLGLGIQLALAAALGATVTVHRRRLRRDLAEPVTDLQHVLGRMADGELGARMAGVGFAELQAAGAGIALLGHSLANEQARAQLRADLLTLQAERFRELLETSRELGGNVDLRHVIETITGAALRLSGWGMARVHLTDDGVRSLSADLLALADGGEDVVPGRAAFSMVMSGHYVGVLELTRDGGGPVRLGGELVEVLSVLASQGAAAIETARLHERLAAESRIDALTGLPNRRKLDEDLRAEVERSRRYGRPLSLLLLDVDHFKRVNDLHGHQTGDDVLRGLAELFGPLLRGTDIAYRYGGEEFVVLLQETDVRAAADVAERLRTTIEQHDVAGMRLTASFGVVELRRDEGTDGLFARADAALYQAKSEGRNCAVVDLVLLT